MWRAATLAMIFVTTAPHLSFAQGTCFSDDELKSVLTTVFLTQLGNGLGTCARKYPQLDEIAKTQLNAFSDRYRSEMRDVRNAATRAYERQVKGKGAELLDKNNAAATQSSKQTYEAYNVEQCKKHITAVEAMVAVDDWHLVVTPPLALSFPQDRARIPKC